MDEGDPSPWLRGSVTGGYRRSANSGVQVNSLGPHDKPLGEVPSHLTYRKLVPVRVAGRLSHKF